MFINNKYYNWYYKIIKNSKHNSVINEIHHIIPKSLGGTDSSDNLCCLTPREHFICHLLLTKMTVGDAKKKMCFALWGMANRNNIKLNSRLYESLRYDFIALNSRTNIEKYGPDKAAEISKKISQTSTGRKFSEESKQKMSLSRKGNIPWNKGLSKENNEILENLSYRLSGIKRSQESIYKQQLTMTGQKKSPHKLESKLKNSISNKNRPYLVCEYCGKEAQKGNYNRWHGTNCKIIKSN